MNINLVKRVKAFMSGGGTAIATPGAIAFHDLVGKNFNGGGSDISEITYYTCLKILSETMGKLPCYVEGPGYKRAETGTFGGLSRLLEIAPNKAQTAAEFFCYLEKCRNHFGNAYAYIETDGGGNVVGLYPLNPIGMTVYINNTDKFTGRRYWYQYADSQSGKTYIFLPEDLIHVKSWVTEPSGYVGKAAREILAEYMRGNKRSQEFLNDLYKNGMTANLAVKYVGTLSLDRQKAVLDRLNVFLRSRSDRVLPVPSDWELQPLDLKLADQQFLEIKKYSAGAIAAAFGLPPTFLNDYSKASYASSSAQNVSFYVNTLLYSITAYEMELTRKLLTEAQQQEGYRIKFNFSVILRANPETQATMLSTYVNSGIYRINEARQKLGLPPVEGGDRNVVNGSCKDINALDNSGEGVQE